MMTYVERFLTVRAGMLDFAESLDAAIYQLNRFASMLPRRVRRRRKKRHMRTRRRAGLVE